MILSAYGSHPLGAFLQAWLSRHDVTADLLHVPRPSGTNAALWIAPKAGFHHALLFLHGMGNDHFYAHADLFSAVVNAGIAVLSIDLDGHGLLSRSVLDAAALAGLAPAGWAYLQRLAPQAMLHLGGYSLGAALSLQAAATLAPATLALLSLPLAHTTKARFLPREATTFLHPLFFAAIRRHGLKAVWPAFGNFGRARYPVRLADATGGEWAYVAEVERFMKRLDVSQLAATLTMPTLWLGGRRDGLCPPRLLTQLARQTPRGQAVALTGAGHLTTLFHEDLGPALVRHMLTAR